MNAIALTPFDVRASHGNQRLESLVSARAYGRVKGLRLERRDEGLVLHGRVRTYYIKQLAQQAILEAGGVPLLANEIEVI